MNTAPPPTRASASVVLSWGLISVPLKIYSGTQDSSISRSEYALINDEIVKVGRVYSIKETGEVIDGDQVFRGVEREDGTVVEVTNDEMKAMLPMENGTAQVVCFVRQSSLFAGKYVLGDLDQVRPGKGAAKPFALLMAAMRKTQSFAVIKLAVRNKAKYAALLPNGDMYTLKFDDDVRERLPLPEVDIQSAEVEMGVEIVKRGLSDERPELVNDEDRALRDLIAGKEAGEPVAGAESTPQGDDLMAALQAQLADS